MESKIKYENKNLYAYELSNGVFEIRYNYPQGYAVTLGQKKSLNDAIKFIERALKYPMQLKAYLGQ